MSQKYKWCLTNVSPTDSVWKPHDIRDRKRRVREDALHRPLWRLESAVLQRLHQWNAQRWKHSAERERYYRLITYFVCVYIYILCKPFLRWNEKCLCSLFFFNSQRLRMGWTWRVTRPGLSSTTLSGTKGTPRGSDSTMWTSGTKINHATRRPLSSSINASSALMAFPTRER